VKFSLREIGWVFSLNYEIQSLKKRPELLYFSFPEGLYFLNCDKTELKKSSKINFSVAERHRWAVVG